MIADTNEAPHHMIRSKIKEVKDKNFAPSENGNLIYPYHILAEDARKLAKNYFSLLKI